MNQPNILLIVTDQHRLSAVGAYGDTPCRTPHLDRLAREGVRFENVYTTSPLCSPARASIITGQYPHTHGTTNNIWSLGCNVSELIDRPTLLSRRLQSAGYRLGYTGKWHLGTGHYPHHIHPPMAEDRQCLPKDVGFEGQNFEGHGGGGQRYPEFQEYLRSRGLRHEVQELISPSGVRFPWAGKLADGVEATEAFFLAEHTMSLCDRFRQTEQPFFIWHNFWGPHAPYWVPREYYERYRDVEIPPWPNYHWPARDIIGPHRASILPEAGRMEWADWAELIRHYYAFTTMIDEQIGRMLGHLESTGQLDNTVVIFTADHGESLGDHGGIFNKGWTHFEETLRIPLIVRFPDGRHAGTVRTELISLADLYPTVLELANGDSSGAVLHGRSVLPLLRGESPDWREHVVTEFHGLEPHPYLQRTIRHKNFKYGFNGVMDDELYDLDADPHEMNNVIGDLKYQSVLADLRQRMVGWMHETHDQAIQAFRKMRAGALPTS